MMLNLNQVTESETSIADFKQLIYFKHVFLVGISAQILDSPSMFKFLNCLLTEKMIPFSLNLIRDVLSRKEIEAKGFGHLCI